MTGIAGSSGGVTLVGLEVPCEGRGSVFLRPGDGLNILYGRNGAGKSSILNGVRCLATGIADVSHGAVALFEIESDLVEGILADVDLGFPAEDPTIHSLPPQHMRGTATHPMSFWLRTFGTLEPPTTDDMETYLSRILGEESASRQRDEILQLKEVFGDDTMEGEVNFLRLMAATASAMISHEPVNPNEDTQESWPDWYLSQLRRALASDLETPKHRDGLEPASRLGTHEEVVQFFEGFGVETPSVDLDSLDTGALRHHLWADLAALLIYRDVSGELADWEKPWEVGIHVEADAPERIGALVRSRLVAITAVGTAQEPRWRVDLAVLASELPGAENRRGRDFAEADDPPSRGLDIGRVQRMFRALKESQDQVASSWDELAAVYETLTEVEREDVARFDGEHAKIRMLSVYGAARDLAGEEREAHLAEGREWALSGRGGDDRTDADDDVLGGEDDPEDNPPVLLTEPSEPVSGVARLLGWDHLDGGRYLKSAIGFMTTAFPWALCDLDECPDPVSDVRARFAGALRSGPMTIANFVEWDGYDEKVDHQLDAEAVTRLQLAIEHAGTFLTDLGIGLGALRLRVDADVRKWLEPGPVALEALDAPSQRWVDVAALSSAQRSWVARVMHLERELRGGFPLLILADEPETGVHAAAAHDVLRLLESTGATSLVASHSTAAFRIPSANLVLVDRDFSGSVVLGTPGTGDDVRVAAVRLGTTPLDLLSMKRLLVYVEGAHDEAVVGTVIAHSIDQSLKERVVVAPARGVRQFGGVAGSVLLTEFTDLHALVIADNARTGDLLATKEEALALLRDGLDASAVKRRLRLGERAGSSEEERVLWDLLERCIDRHVLHRVHFHGLVAGDIIETLPPEAFGLRESWSALRQEHSRFRGVDFKTWLRQDRSASISVRTIRDAVNALDALPDDLVNILRSVEEADGAARAF